MLNSKTKQTRPIFEDFPAKERAKFLEGVIVDQIRRKKFQFAAGKGYLDVSTSPPCGCVLGGLRLFCNGNDSIIFREIKRVADTGLATVKELEALEEGYEVGEDLAPWYRKSPFFKAGLRLRSRKDATPFWKRK